MQVIILLLTRQIPVYLYSYFNITSVVIIYLITSCDIHLPHCVYTIVVCSVFIIVTNFALYCIKSIHYHFMRDHESSSFRKLATNRFVKKPVIFFVINLETFLILRFKVKRINLVLSSPRWILSPWSKYQLLLVSLTSLKLSLWKPRHV